MKSYLKFYFFFSSFFISQVSIRSQIMPFQLGGNLVGIQSNENFGNGSATNFDGSMVVVGSPNSNLNGQASGAVRVYQWTNGWAQLGNDIPGEAAGDLCGRSVGMSRDGLRIAVGAHMNNGNTPGSHCGHVRIFEWNGNNWNQMGIDIDGLPNMQSGIELALSGDGNTVIVASGDGWTGYVRIYQWNGNAWTQKGNTLTGGNADNFGRSVDINHSGSRIIVGIDALEPAPGMNLGAFNVYDWNGTNWVSYVGFYGSNNSRFGYQVRLDSSGSRAAVSAPHLGGVGYLRGQVFVYDLNSFQYQVITGDADYDNAGSRIDLNYYGTLLAVLSPNYYNNDSGKLSVYAMMGNNWVKQVQDIPGEYLYSPFNNTPLASICLSGNGKRLVNGEGRDNGLAGNTGNCRVFQLDGTIPCQPNIEINGSPWVIPVVESMDSIHTLGTVTITPGNDIRFDAHPSGYVKLTPGFLAQNGSVFVAQAYNGCQPGTPSLPMSRANVEPENLSSNRSGPKVYPNPNKGVIYIEHDSGFKQVALYSIAGNLLKNWSTGGTLRAELGISELANGMYYLKIDGNPVIKIVKNGN